MAVDTIKCLYMYMYVHSYGPVYLAVNLFKAPKRLFSMLLKHDNFFKNQR